MSLNKSTSANGNSGQSTGVSLETLLQAMEKKLDDTASWINQSIDERIRSRMAEVHQIDKELLNVQSRQESGAQCCPPETEIDQRTPPVDDRPWADRAYTERQPSSSYKELEPKRCNTPLQDRGYAHSPIHSKAQKLADKNRSKWCIFQYPSGSKTTKILEVFDREWIHMPAIRSVECTLGLYEDPQTCVAQRARGQDGSIHRRHSDNVAIREPSVGAHRSNHLTVGKLWVRSPPRQIGTTLHPEPRISGHGHNHSQYDTTSARGEVEKDPARSTESAKEWEGYHQDGIQDQRGKCLQWRRRFPPAPLFFRSQQRDLARDLEKGDQCYEAPYHLSQNSRKELEMGIRPCGLSQAQILLSKPFSRNFRMAQTMQWLHAILNYMNKWCQAHQWSHPPLSWPVYIAWHTIALI